MFSLSLPFLADDLYKGLGDFPHSSLFPPCGASFDCHAQHYNPKYKISDFPSSKNALNRQQVSSFVREFQGLRGLLPLSGSWLEGWFGEVCPTFPPLVPFLSMLLWFLDGLGFPNPPEKREMSLSRPLLFQPPPVFDCFSINFLPLWGCYKIMIILFPPPLQHFVHQHHRSRSSAVAL